MTERIRLTYDVPERVRRALNIFAARKGLSVSGAIEYLVESFCMEDLALADQAISDEEANPHRRRRPRDQD